MQLSAFTTLQATSSQKHSYRNAHGTPFALLKSRKQIPKKMESLWGSAGCKLAPTNKGTDFF